MPRRPPNEALTEDLEANGVRVVEREPVAVSMTENIEGMVRVLSGPAKLVK